MAKYLVIVESPAKVKTIKKFLGKNYEVAASNGHVRDLPKSQMGIDIEHDFEPKYITIRGKGEVLAKLRKQVKKADKIFLATDPDREGEAISWHLYYSLKLQDKQVYRISFNEITKEVVKQSIKEPREINQNLVDAQQARRELDRIVGYEISPILWAKVKRGLSAGRVQSVALRIICDREEKINAFIPREYWTMSAFLEVPGLKNPLEAKMITGADAKNIIKNQEEAEEIKEAVESGELQVVSVKKGEKIKKPPLPFVTSSLQQEASKVLNFTTKKTMRIAQQLYEGVAVKGEGTVGLITYLRTDSTRVSEVANESAAKYIIDNFGAKYIGHNGARNGKNNVQDAHEAIRPTDINRSPATIKPSLSREQFRLYQLIWKRFVASRMTNAVYETYSVRLENQGYPFSISSSKVVFEGYRAVYSNDTDDKSIPAAAVKYFEKGQELVAEHVEEAQHFTQPPAHYTEASLVKVLEELGVGRPSTYAPTISTILARRYIAKEGKSLFVTELGEIVNHIMKEAFSDIVDERFTAHMEEALDKVAEGKMEWKQVLRDFYPDFAIHLERAQKELEKVEIRDEVTEEICENCGRNMVIKYGPHGKFLACPGFPECKNTKPYYEKTGVPCPKCGGEIALKKTRKGRKYYGCINAPECDFMSWQKVSLKPCPICGSYMTEKGSKLACSDPQCGYVEKNEKEKTD